MILIIADGKKPNIDIINKYVAQAQFIIATDGAYDYLTDVNIIPNYVIGDMDSITKQIDDNVIIIKDEDQETTDLEKAINFVITLECNDVIVLGATGGRLDHTLYNLHLLKKYQNLLELTYIDNYFTILLPKDRSIKFAGKNGVLISLLSLSNKVVGISTVNLRYPLINEDLENGIRSGCSNEITADFAEISWHEGDLIVMIGND
jgi:thiamine pyrophosphokinase